MDTDLKFTLYSQRFTRIVDLVLGIKNVFELEGVTNSWGCCFKFSEQIPTKRTCFET